MWIIPTIPFLCQNIAKCICREPEFRNHSWLSVSWDCLSSYLCCCSALAFESSKPDMLSKVLSRSKMSKDTKLDHRPCDTKDSRRWWINFPCTRRHLRPTRKSQGQMRHMWLCDELSDELRWQTRVDLRSSMLVFSTVQCPGWC